MFARQKSGQNMFARVSELQMPCRGERLREIPPGKCVKEICNHEVMWSWVFVSSHLTLKFRSGFSERRPHPLFSDVVCGVLYRNTQTVSP